MPKNFVMSDSSKGGGTFPGSWRCKDIYDGWWKGKPGCHSSTAVVTVDEAWLRDTIETYAVRFAERHQVPVHCNRASPCPALLSLLEAGHHRVIRP